MTNLDPEQADEVGKTFNIAEAMAREVVFQNDEAFYGSEETPEYRYERMLEWVNLQIKEQAAAQ
jgi:hypothetical protein